MTITKDARLVATREMALEAALDILQSKGVLAITHASISARTGISRSTLYRHWPKLDQVRFDAFARATRATQDTNVSVRTNGPLRADLTWLLGFLMVALSDMPWGKIAPQVIAAAAIEDEARSLMDAWIKDRKASVEKVFQAAIDRGEIVDTVPLEALIEMTIAVPYFRKLVAGQPLDHDWLDTHVDMICSTAEKISDKN